MFQKGGLRIKIDENSKVVIIDTVIYCQVYALRDNSDCTCQIIKCRAFPTHGGAPQDEFSAQLTKRIASTTTLLLPVPCRTHVICFPKEEQRRVCRMTGFVGTWQIEADLQ